MSRESANEKQQIHRESENILHLSGKDATASKVQQQLQLMPMEERGKVIHQMESDAHSQGTVVPGFVILGIASEIVREAKDPSVRSINSTVDALEQDRDIVTRELEKFAQNDTALLLHEKNSHLFQIDVNENGVINTKYKEGNLHKAKGFIHINEVIP